MHGVCPGRDRVFRVVPPCFPEIKVSGQLCVVHGLGLQAVREEVRSASQGLLGMQIRSGAGGRGGSETGCVCLEKMKCVIDII